jgi:hypothetical protein
VLLKPAACAGEDTSMISNVLEAIKAGMLASGERRVITISSIYCFETGEKPTTLKGPVPTVS